RFLDLNPGTNKEGDLVVMSRNGEVAIVEEGGKEGRERERERYPLVYGAKLKVKHGQKIKGGQRLAEWDPYTVPILTEVAGTVKFGDLIDGVTIEERLDERTGLSNLVVIGHSAASHHA